jgi:hypothetical protein
MLGLLKEVLITRIELWLDGYEVTRKYGDGQSVLR